MFSNSNHFTISPKKYTLNIEIVFTYPITLTNLLIFQIFLVICCLSKTIAQLTQQSDYVPDRNGKYYPSDEGEYIHDDSGRYIPDYSGLYHHDGLGRYKHLDSE